MLRPYQRILSGFLIYMLVTVFYLPSEVFSRPLENSETRVKVTDQTQRGVVLLDSVRQGVKNRRAQLEQEAREIDEKLGLPPVFNTARRQGLLLKNTDPYYDAMNAQKIHDRKQRSVAEIKRNQVKVRADILLIKVKRWSQMDREQILALSTDEINGILNESFEIAGYYGYDTEKLTRLYELGKKTIRESLFELPENTHPDNDYSYERMKKNALDGALEGAKPGLYRSFRDLFDNYYDNATNREVEIAEFMAKKQEYRVTLFKRVTFNYVYALLLASKPLPPCQVKTRPIRYQVIQGKKIAYLGCPDESLDYLKKYVAAIQKLQGAESDNFIFQAKMLVVEQQMVADLASSLPVIGDGVDWFKLAYGMYFHETLSGHCFSRLDQGIELVAAMLPLVSSAAIKKILARNADLAFKEKGGLARLIINTGEIKTGLAKMATYNNVRRAAYATRAEANSVTGKLVHRVTHNTPVLEDFANRWGVSPKEMERFSESIMTTIDLIEKGEGGELAEMLASDFVDTAEGELEKEVVRRLARLDEGINSGKANEEVMQILLEREKLLYKQKNEAKMARIMGDTIDNAEAEIETLKRLQKEVPEVFEIAQSNARKTLDDVLLSMQPARAQVLKESGLVPEHVDEFLNYLKRRAGGSEGKEAQEKIALLYRYVNEDATALIKAGFDTKPMSIKGKSSDWGVHRAFIPVDQALSKLGNPNKGIVGTFSPEDVAKMKEFNKKVREFFEGLGDNADLYRTTLFKNDMPVYTIFDKRAGQKVTAYLDASGNYLDELENIIPKRYIDLSISPEPLQVLAIPNKEGIPIPVTADYDLLAFGFTSKIQKPEYNDLTGFVNKKQEHLMGKMNRWIQEKFDYMGKLMHHGPEVQYPASPGAFQDHLVTAVDLVDGGRVLQIKRCDFDCMKTWCTKTGYCTPFGFPATPICNPVKPKKPCIKVDPDRLLKDYMHAMRMNGYKYFPNANWGWGKYNVGGGWTMMNYMDTKPSFWNQYGSHSVYQTLKDSEFLLQNAKQDLKKEAAKYMLQGYKYAIDCPYGKRESDFIEATP